MEGKGFLDEIEEVLTGGVFNVKGQVTNEYAVLCADRIKRELAYRIISDFVAKKEIGVEITESIRIQEHSLTLCILTEKDLTRIQELIEKCRTNIDIATLAIDLAGFRRPE